MHIYESDYCAFSSTVYNATATSVNKSVTRAAVIVFMPFHIRKKALFRLWQAWSHA